MTALFRKMSPAAARLETMLNRHGRNLPFTAVGGAWLFSPALKPGKHGVTAYGKAGQTEFTVWLNEPGWRLAAATVLETPELAASELPPALLHAALECFFSGALASLEKALGLPVSLSRVEVRESAPLSSSIPFRLVRGDGLEIGGAWAPSEGEWSPALEKALAARPPATWRLPEALPLEGVVAVAMWRTTLAELAGMEKGDVALSPAGAAWTLTVGRRLRFAAGLREGILVADGKTMTDAAGGRAATGAAAKEGVAPKLTPIGEAEVELEARVGSIGITLAQLRQLSAGQVVEFATAVESPATLVVGGRAVAFGELVDVGGRVGVRITAMAEE